MALFEPKNLASTLAPTLLIHRVLLMGITHHAAGRARRRLGLMYSATICISYGVASFLSHTLRLPLERDVYDSFAAVVLERFFSANCYLGIACVVVAILRNKDHDDCVAELMDIDEAIKKMGVARPYGPLLMQHTLQLSASILTICTTNIWQYTSSIREYIRSVFWYSMKYSTLLLILGDNALCIFNRVMTERFEDLNSLLKSMRIQNEDDYNTRMGTLIRVEAIFEDQKKLEKLKSIRKIYTRLDNLANRWTKLNEVHILYTVIFAIYVLTLGAYTIYSAYLAPDIQPHQGSPSRVTHYLCACIIHIVKLLMIVCPAAALTAEARKTRRILLEHLQPIAFLRSEVNQFSWDLIQDPIRLSVRGLFDLNYTLIQTFVRWIAEEGNREELNLFGLLPIVGTVATYLVFLVQTTNP